MKWIIDCEKVDAKEVVEDILCQLGQSDEILKVSILNWNYDLKRNKDKELLKEKIKYLSDLNPDILVIQECTYHECIYFKNYYKYVNWYGDGKDGIYGVSVLSNKFKSRIVSYSFYEQKFRYVVPYEININGIPILLLVVWTKDYLRTKNIFNSENKDDDVHNLGYTDNIIEAIDFYNDLLIKYSDVIIVGDFNSFDKKPNRKEYQINIENKLKQFDIHNCTLFPRYVPLDGQNFETEITYYHRYKQDKAATNDYCFLKKSSNTNFIRFGIGHPDKWIKYSDHFPLWIDLGVKKPNFTL